MMKNTVMLNMTHTMKTTVVAMSSINTTSLAAAIMDLIRSMHRLTGITTHMIGASQPMIPGIGIRGRITEGKAPTLCTIRDIIILQDIILIPIIAGMDTIRLNLMGDVSLRDVTVFSRETGPIHRFLPPLIEWVHLAALVCPADRSVPDHEFVMGRALHPVNAVSEHAHPQAIAREVPRPHVFDLDLPAVRKVDRQGHPRKAEKHPNLLHRVCVADHPVVLRVVAALGPAVPVLAIVVEVGVQGDYGGFND